MYQSFVGVPSGSVSGGQEYVVRMRSAGPRAPMSAATSPTNASTSATRTRLLVIYARAETVAELRRSIQRRCQSWNTKSVQSGLR